MTVRRTKLIGRESSALYYWQLNTVVWPPGRASQCSLAAVTAHTIADQVAAIVDIPLPTFASPTIEGVTVHDTDVIYGVYREKMIEAQKKHLDFFKDRMKREA